MSILQKINQRASDPVFYRKRWFDLIRPFRSFNDRPQAESLADLGTFDSAVVVVAHPDDETFCGGLLCELVEAGTRITLVCLTKGEGGPTGEVTREELGKVREEELRKSAAELQISEVIFLNHVDPVARKYRVFAPEVSSLELSAQLLPLIQNYPLVISHGSNGEYWHAAHLLVHESVKLALEQLPETAWLTFLARNPDHPIPRMINWDDSVYLRFDTAKWRERRKAAIHCHQSQLGLFARFAGGTVDDFLERTSIETYSLQQPRGRESG